MGGYRDTSPLPGWATISFEEYRAGRIVRSIRRHMAAGETILDCGCGSMLLARRLQAQFGSHVFGSDVINLNRTDLALCLCPGEHLAFAAQSVDVVCLIAVLHHTEDAEATLQECLRVARRRVIIMEDVYHNALEHRSLMVLDWLGNRSVSLAMSLPFHFKSETEWMNMFAKLGANLTVAESIRPIPWRPSRHRLYVLDKA